MTRVTYFKNNHWVICNNGQEISGPWIDRLATYEDLGLEPAEISAVLKKAALLETSDANKRWYEVLVGELSTRTWNAMLRSERTADLTLSQLALLDKRTILCVRNMGAVSRREVADALYSLGYTDTNWGDAPRNK